MAEHPINPGTGAAGPTVGNRAVAHTKWIVSAPVVAKAIGLGATIVLARLLAPEQFGLMAYAGTALAFFAVFQDLGLTQTLIAHAGDVTGHLRPALAMSLGAGLVFYALLAAIAVPLAVFVDEPLVGPVLLVMGVVVVLQTAGQVQYALLVRSERYPALFGVTVLQAVVYLLVAVTLARGGFGVWSLVFGHVAAQLARTLSLWSLSSWRPWGGGQHGRLVHLGLLRFGGALTLVSLLDWAADGWVFVTVGKLLGSDALGLYNLSFEASRMAYFGLSALAGSVALTSYASLRAKPEELRRLMLKGLRVVHSLAFPAAAGIAALAPWIVPLVWGPKWLDAVPLLGLLALIGFVTPLTSVVFPYFVSSGQLGVLLRLTAVRLVLYALAISVAASFGVVATAATHVAVMALMSLTMLLLAARRVGFGGRELVAAVLAPALRAVACGLAAGLAARSLDGRSLAVVLPAGVLAGAAVYATAFLLTDREGFFETASVLARGSGVWRHGS